MLTEPKESVSDADLIITVVDVSNKWHRRQLDGKVLELLKKHANKPAVLVLNKVDLLSSKNILLEVTHSLTEGIVGNVPIALKHIKKSPTKQQTNELENILKGTNEDKQKQSSDEIKTTNELPSSTDDKISNDLPRSDGWPHFERVFMVSALNKDGIGELKTYLMSETKSSNWQYSPHVVTNEKSQDIIKMAVREKLLDHLPQEIPYNLVLTIELLEVEQPGFMRVAVLIKVPKEHQMKLVIGGGGRIIRKVVDEARQELMDTFRCDIVLKLIVQCSEKKRTKMANKSQEKNKMVKYK